VAWKLAAGRAFGVEKSPGWATPAAALGYALLLRMEPPSTCFQMLPL
jgi:hypothetical protein